jgi:hypothetical protein
MTTLPRIASLVALALLSILNLASCSIGSGLQNVTGRRAAMIGYGEAGGTETGGYLPRSKAKPADEAAVDAAIKAGIEEAFSRSPMLKYVPHSQVIGGTQLDKFAYGPRDTIKFAEINHLDLVMRIYINRNLLSGRVYLNMLIQSSTGKNVGLGITNVKGAFPKPAGKFKELKGPETLPIWRETAAQAARQALAKMGG